MQISRLILEQIGLARCLFAGRQRLNAGRIDRILNGHSREVLTAARMNFEGWNYILTEDDGHGHPILSLSKLILEVLFDF